MLVTREFYFDSTHHLTKYYGKCERVHGHTYKLEVTLSGKVHENGMLIDFTILKRLVNKHVLEKLDHYDLNDFFENPTAENIIVWIWDQLKDLKGKLMEELNDPNLSEELKKYLNAGDTAQIDGSEFDNELKLHELKLWEGEGKIITYRGE